MRIAEIFSSVQGEGRLTGTPSVFVRTSGCNLRCRWCDTPYASWRPEGEELSVSEILDRIEQAAERAEDTSGQWSVVSGQKVASGEWRVASEGGCPEPRTPNPRIPASPAPDSPHIVLTGGEPMLSAELIPLGVELHLRGWHITVETSGTLYLPVACDLMSISPKMSNSTPPAELDPRWAWRHELNRHAPDVVSRLLSEYDCQLKFVIETPDDCREVEEYLGRLPAVEPWRVMLMPQGVAADELAARGAWLEPYCAARGWTFCPRRQVEWFGAVRGK
jgi:7-carboxy-7-deazaguanine synthase